MLMSRHNRNENHRRPVGVIEPQRLIHRISQLRASEDETAALGRVYAMLFHMLEIENGGIAACLHEAQPTDIELVVKRHFNPRRITSSNSDWSARLNRLIVSSLCSEGVPRVGAVPELIWAVTGYMMQNSDRHFGHINAVVGKSRDMLIYPERPIRVERAQAEEDIQSLYLPG
jgi:hypothetical protein